MLIPIFFALLIFSMTLVPAYPETIQLITKKGNVINVEVSRSQEDNNGSHYPNSPKVIAQSMIDGMGIQSRIIQKENDGRITHGQGDEGQDDSIRPYLKVSNADFAATILEQDTELIYSIPNFWHKYDFVSTGLVDITVPQPNILGYSQTRTLTGSTAASNHNEIHAFGNGRILMKLNDYSGQNIILRGDAVGGIFKIITSPIDLMGAAYGTYGYQTYSGNIDPGPNSISVVAGLDSTHTGIFSYNQNYNSLHRDTPRGPLHYHPAASPVSTASSLAEANSGDHMRITGDNTIPFNISQSYYVDPTGTSNYHFDLYDTLPSYEKINLTGQFEQSFVFPPEQAYLYAENVGPMMMIRGESNTISTPFLEISNLPINTPYQITKDGLTIVTGMTSATGTILIDSVNNSPDTVGGFLKLFPDSLAYRGSFGTVVFDNLHMQTIHIPTVDDKTYVVYAYANIPVTGAITVVNLNLDGQLLLSYLDGDYVSGNAIQVPVIPGFATINLTINGVPTSLNYADILGGTGIKIASPTGSTATNHDLDNRILSISASAGTPTFVVATSDGTINAIMSETISGTVTITNKYTLQAVPPLPPRPAPRDPLEGFVEIYINGDLVRTQTLGVNPNPAFVATNTLSGNSAVQSVTYTYADYTLSGSTSVSVSTGDFVEFYMYGQILGEIESYSPPGGFVIRSEQGSASAVINIRDAHIQTST